MGNARLAGRKGSVGFLFAVLLALLLPVGVSAAVTVDGFVLDRGGGAVEGVTVSIITVGRADPITTIRTDKNGYYKMTVTLTGAFDLTYTHSKYLHCVVERLAESKNQQVSKTIFLKSEAQSANALQDYLQTLDRTVFLAGALAGESRDKLLTYFAKDWREGGLLRDVKKDLSDPIYRTYAGRALDDRLSLLKQQFADLSAGK